VVAVNVSTRQLGTASTLRQAAVDALAASGLPADCLCLEITESALADDTEAAVATLQELWALGIRLSIDDFGTGFSSLSYLTQFPIDELKVDRSFVAAVASDPRAAAIVRSVVALSKSLGVDCVAEGVEDAVQLAFLRDLDCTSAQGFLLSRPVPGHAVPALLAERSPTFLAAVAEGSPTALSGFAARRPGAPRRSGAAG
jgi:EAL domain-containing protein (putative c-di-GMP-specific phosphodiesterase class I)